MKKYGIRKISKRIVRILPSLFFLFLASLTVAIYIKLLSVNSPRFVAGTDFVAFITGARVIQAGKGELLYDLGLQFLTQQLVVHPLALIRLLPYLNLPFIAASFLPFTKYSLVEGYRMFLLFNLGVFFMLWFLISRVFSKIQLFSAWIVVPLLFFPVLKTLYMGQISLVMMIFYLLGFWKLKSKMPFGAGFYLGVFFLVKIQYLIALPFFIVMSSNRWRFSAGVFSSFLALFLVSIYFSGLQTLLSYPMFLVNIEVGGLGGEVGHMYSFYSLLSNLGIDWFWSLFLNGVFYLFLLLVFIQHRSRVSIEKSFIAATCFFLPLAVHVWDHDLVFLLVPIMILVNEMIMSVKKFSFNAFLIIIVLMLLPGFFFLDFGWMGALVLIFIGLGFMDVKPRLLIDQVRVMIRK